MSESSSKRSDAPVVLITGASSGFGRATAELLGARGYRVFGTSRNPSATASHEMVVMDVDDDESVAAGVAAVVHAAGRIDVLVNNAGVVMAGSIEDTTMEEAKQQLETNLFGVVRVTRAVLPHMRAAGGGKIINMSSIGGLISLPFQAFYCMSKFAVEAFTEALRMEVKAFNIKVCCIEPGDFRTEMTDKRIYVAAADSEAYGRQTRVSVDSYADDERNGSDPVLVARLVLRLIEEKDPKPRYMVGSPLQKAGPILKRLVGSRLFERVMLQHARIGKKAAR